MKILNRKLSSKAQLFIDNHIRYLDRDIEYGTLPDCSEFYGSLSCSDSSFYINIRESVPDTAFEAILCHEMYHAYQMSCDFPFLEPTEKVRGNDTMNKYFLNLQSSILDLSADDTVKAYGLDASYVMDF